MSSGLTKGQINQLAEELIDTSQNVYVLSERMFGRSVEDRVFDDLKKEGEIFKCELGCDTWKALSSRDPAFDGSDVCAECADQLDKDHDAEEGDC